MAPFGKNIQITLAGLIGLFLLQVGAPGFNRLVDDFLIVSAWRVLHEGYVWTLLTSVLWHQDAGHIFTNGLTLFFFGGYLDQRWSTRQFWLFCLLCALGSGLAIIGWQTAHAGLLSLAGDLGFWQALASTSYPTLGYSGVVTGLLAAFSYFMWNQRFNLFFFPLTGKTFFFLIIGIDILRMLSGSNISVSAHMGGLFIGLALTHFFFRDGSTSPRRRVRASDFQKELMADAEAALADQNWREAYRVCHQLRAASQKMPPKMMSRVWEILSVTSVKMERFDEAESYIRHAPDTSAVRDAHESLLRARASS